jgi:acyl carrier protein
MDRLTAENALRKAITTCVGLEDVDLSKPMKHYEISSLDNVEIISMTTRSLKVKAPRAELLRAQNMNQLIDVIVRAAAG